MSRKRMYVRKGKIKKASAALQWATKPFDIVGAGKAAVGWMSSRAVGPGTETWRQIHPVSQPSGVVRAESQPGSRWSGSYKPAGVMKKLEERVTGRAPTPAVVDSGVKGIVTGAGTITKVDVPAVRQLGGGKVQQYTKTQLVSGEGVPRADGPSRPQWWWDQYAGYEHLITPTKTGWDTRTADKAVFEKTQIAAAKADPLRVAVRSIGFPRYYGGEGAGEVQVGGITPGEEAAYLARGSAVRIRPTESEYLSVGVPKVVASRLSALPEGAGELVGDRPRDVLSEQTKLRIAGAGKPGSFGTVAISAGTREVLGITADQRARKGKGGKIKKQIVKRSPPAFDIGVPKVPKINLGIDGGLGSRKIGIGGDLNVKGIDVSIKRIRKKKVM